MRRQVQLSVKLPEATCCVQTWNRSPDSIKPPFFLRRDTKQAPQTAYFYLQVYLYEHTTAKFRSLQLKECKCFLYMPSNCQQSEQAWSACFKCNTFFVLQVLFSLEVLPALPAVILNWRVCLPTEAFVWQTFLPTGSYELCQQCWLSVIAQLISASFNAQAIKCSTCRAQEWSFQQSNKYPVIL